jgi:hypothetical protein
MCFAKASPSFPPIMQTFLKNSLVDHIQPHEIVSSPSLSIQEKTFSPPWALLAPCSPSPLDH